jgi:Poly(R)-hydroxyalkanoic acid synthase subunit (PHA_synth_III_E)
MSESNEVDGDSIAEWIERQREKLRESAAQGATGSSAAPDLTTLGQRWLELAKSYLEGLAQFAAAGTHARPGFQLGDDLLGAWRIAFTSGSMATDAATERFADMLRRLPPVGLAREHTEAWRELADAQLECRRLEQEFKDVLTRVQSDALSLLDEKVREREHSGAPIASFRDLYELWVNCGEEVYAKVAHSDSYARLQAQLGNATMRFRARQQTAVEHALRQLDLPTRSELNSVHRQLRELRSQLTSRDQGRSAPSEPTASDTTARKTKATRPKAGRKTARRDRRRGAR